ncbi:SnoaL-like domain-containing protein [Schizosaccharomyces pombe]
MSQDSESFIRQLFKAFTDFSTDVESLRGFLTPDYRQLVDGRELTLDDFISHAKALRTHLQRLDINVQQIVCQGNKAATVHIAHAIRSSGESSRIKVIAFYSFKDGRISLIDELTYVLEGGNADRELGSVQ